MTVFGNREKALTLIEDEPLVTSGTDPKSAYGKLYEMGGYVLLIGVSHNKNTFLHCVEEMLDTPNRLSQEPREVRVKLASGEILTRHIRTHEADFTNDISTRFPKYETAFRYHGAIKDGFFGNAPIQMCDTRIMKETMALIAKRAEGKDPLADEYAFPPKWYV